MLQITLAGRLGADAEIVKIKDTEYIRMSVAAYTYKDNTEWVEVLRKKPEGEFKPLKYLTKGSAVLVQGSPRVSAYTSKKGEQIAKLTCYAERADLLNSTYKSDE